MYYLKNSEGKYWSYDLGDWTDNIEEATGFSSSEHRYLRDLVDTQAGEHFALVSTEQITKL